MMVCTDEMNIIPSRSRSEQWMRQWLEQGREPREYKYLIIIPAMLSRKPRKEFPNSTGYDNDNDCNNHLGNTMARNV